MCVCITYVCLRFLIKLPYMHTNILIKLRYKHLPCPRNNPPPLASPGHL